MSLYAAESWQPGISKSQLPMTHSLLFLAQAQDSAHNTIGPKQAKLALEGARQQQQQAEDDLEYIANALGESVSSTNCLTVHLQS